CLMVRFRGAERLEGESPWPANIGRLRRTGVRGPVGSVAFAWSSTAVPRARGPSGGAAGPVEDAAPPPPSLTVAVAVIERSGRGEARESAALDIERCPRMVTMITEVLPRRS